MTRSQGLALATILAASCGGQPAPPPRHARSNADELVEPVAPVPLVPLTGDCQPDPSPLDVPDTTFATDTVKEGQQVRIRIAYRHGRGVLGIACTRATFEGEERNEIDALEATIGQTQVVLVVDTARCQRTCEGEPCDAEVTAAWVFDQELRLIGGVVDPQGGYAEVQDGKLVVGPERRTVRGGTLVTP